MIFNGSAARRDSRQAADNIACNHRAGRRSVTGGA